MSWLTIIGGAVVRVAATPRTVSASYEMDGFEYELDVPVFARHMVEQAV